MIHTTPFPLVGRGSDSLAWRSNPRGVFDLKNAYSLVNGAAQDSSFSAKFGKLTFYLELKPLCGNVLITA